MRWELILFLIGLVAIPFGCLAPSRWMPPLPQDKLLHFVAFGGMALLAGRLVPQDSVLLVLAAVFAAGVLIELLQKLIPGRNFCWRDLAANGAGIAAAGLCLAVLPA
jgi:VanZ family protein